MYKQSRLIVIIYLIVLTHCIQNDFFMKYDIKLVSKDHPDLKVYNYDQDRIITNMKPIMMNEELKFMDEHNYQKYLKGASIELKRNKIFKGIFYDTKFKCFEDKTYQQFKSKTDKQNIFRRGKCLPVIVIPGLMATRLKVNIDCEKVDKAISDQCSSVCQKYYEGDKSQRFNNGVIWFSLLSGVGKILKSQSNYCLGKLYEMTHKKEDIRDQKHMSNLEGIQVIVDDYGNSKEGQCGKWSIQHIDGDMYFNPLEQYIGDLKGFSKMFEYFENEMGYENGINYFSVPYDFRQSLGDDDLVNNFKRTLEWSYKLNKKKALIVSHSLGGVQTAFNLVGLDQEFKDKYIERLVTIGSPQSGAVSMNYIWQGIKTSYQIEVMGYGFGVDDYRSMVLTMPVYKDLIVVYSFMNEQWYKDIIYRNEIEQLYRDSKVRQLDSKEQQKLDEYMTQTVYESKSFNFIPFPWDYSEYDPNVGLNIIDYSKTPIMQTKNKNYYVSFEDQEQLLLKNSLRYNVNEDYSVTEQRVKRVFDQIKEVQDIRSTPPNIPITVLYSSQMDTMYSYVTSDDEPNPISSHSNGKLYDKGKFLFHKGDGSIEITQALLRPLHWAHSFDSNTIKYPIEFIEYGATFGPYLNPKQSYQNDNSKNKFRLMYGNEYTHSQLIQDPDIISLVEQIIMAGENHPSFKDIPSFETEFIQSEKCLSEMKDLCINLYADRKLDSAEQLLTFLYDKLGSDYIMNPRQIEFMNQ